MRRDLANVKRLCAVLTFAALLPLTLYRWFPTQDGPSHLYNAMLLTTLDEPSAVVTSAVFERRLAIVPNWTAYILLAVLGSLFTPFVALKIVIALCVASIPAATLYLQKSFKSHPDPTAFLGVMLAYSSMLFMGFFNFILGCALFAWTIGFRWRKRSEVPIVTLYLLLTLCYLTHGFAFSATVLSLVLLALVERRLSDIVLLVPPLGVAAVDAWPRLHGQRGFQDLAWHVKRLVTFDSFAYFRAVHANIASATSILIFLAVVVTLYRKRDWPPILLSAMFLLLFFVSPWSYATSRSQGLWLNERFLLLFAMTLPAWLELPRMRIVSALIALLTVAHLSTTWRDVAIISDDIESVVRCRGAIPEHTTLDVLGQPPRVVTKLDPLRHAPAYLAVDRDVAYLGDYEAKLEDFPIRFRSESRPLPEFLLVWEGVKANGSLVCEGQGFRVLRSTP